MQLTNQFKHTWKVYFKRGGGQAIVYGNNEQEAKIAALAFWRKQKSMMDNCTPKEIIKHLEPIS